MNKNENEQSNALYLRQNELAQKNITLQVLKDHLKANKTLCQEKKFLLEKEIKTLDEVHSKVWNLQNKMCNQVWSFSVKHDLNEIIHNFPDFVSDLSLLCECEHENHKVPEENFEIEKLTLEIQNLKSNLKNVKCDSLEKELILAEQELQMCEQDSPEVERLKKEIKTCEERIISLRSKIGIEHNRIESNRNNFGTSKSNLQKISVPKHSPILSMPQTYLNASKEINYLRDSFVLDDGGFVKASTYLSTNDNPIQFQNTPSCEKIVAEAVSNEKPKTFKNLPRKKFVVKTKSGITQRR